VKQRIIPTLLQCTGYQTIGRVNFLIASFGECDFIGSAFETRDAYGRACTQQSSG